METEIANYQAQLGVLDSDIEDIKARIGERETELAAIGKADHPTNQRLPQESQRDFLIRTGKITPFSKIADDTSSSIELSLEDALRNAEKGEPEVVTIPDEQFHTDERSHRVLLRPGFIEIDESSETSSDAAEASDKPAKRRRLRNGKAKAVTSDSPSLGSDESFDPDLSDRQFGQSYADEVDDDSGDIALLDPDLKRKRSKRKPRTRESESEEGELADPDDGDEQIYQTRLKSWCARRCTARSKINAPSQGTDSQDDEPEWQLPHPTIPSTDIGDGLKVPGDIFPALFDYQKTGTTWLRELYSNKTGGILGDEMGLGKTIQVIAFLSSLHHSGRLQGPVVIVAPVTVMKQWVNEFHTWWPALRVSILHSSGSGMVGMKHEAYAEDEFLEDRRPSTLKKPRLTKAQKAAKRIIDNVVKTGHVIVTSYSGLQTYAEMLLPVEWGYAVLDEGHQIRNPDAAITLYAKELRTPHRLVVSGTPMQNNMIELWSLIDFIFPGKLGNLLDFKYTFEVPIRTGGYANASNLQIQTAAKCAQTLKESIKMHYLSRLKSDVAADLPKKTEKVIFCRLTKPQREAYEAVLGSEQVNAVLTGKAKSLAAIDILRKICNHPDLQEHKVLSKKPGYNYGNAVKSGKLVVAKDLIKLFKDTGHKTLLFAQQRITLDILERNIQKMHGVNYRRMDGTTNIANRQAMVNEFNTNPDAHVFLLTTKVGGLGLNLTGADRVIIFDPNWNPATDIQARERSWRLGQTRDVAIYRLMVAGTVEEKIYHRQIYKQHLTNKILKDSKQRQAFQQHDLHDLFTLGTMEDDTTETSRMFKGSEVKFNTGSSGRQLDTESFVPWGGTSPPPPLERDYRRQSSSTKERAAPDAVEEVDGIAAIEAVESETESDDGVPNTDDRLMEALFSRAGVHSALEHDDIIDGKRRVTADPGSIEREATKVARQAANHLKKSEAIAKTREAGTVTFTGRYGTSNHPQASRFPRNRGGPSSSGVLEVLQGRLAEQDAAAGPSRPRSMVNAAAIRERKRLNFVRKIQGQLRDFFEVHRGRVHTQNMTDHFLHKCNGADEKDTFLKVLREIAVLERPSNTGRGLWTLKEQYRQGRLS